MRLIILFSFISTFIFAQKTCVYSTNETDSIGTLKITKEVLMYEKLFGESKKYIYFALGNDNGLPFLSLSIIEKDNKFIPTICFDNKSRLYVQLSNGKILSLLCNEVEKCSQNLPGAEGSLFSRIVQANFLFPKTIWEDLKNNTIEILRISSSTSTQDIVVKDAIESSLNKDFFRPNQIFMDYLHCIE
jgi:hypothetical protein